MALMDLLPRREKEKVEVKVEEKVEAPRLPVAPPSHRGMLEIGGMYPTYWDTADPSSVALAEARFDAAITAGYTGQSYRPGIMGMGGSTMDGEITRTFDPQANVVVMSLPYAGG